jgi:hypothetical protein
VVFLVDGSETEGSGYNKEQLVGRREDSEVRGQKRVISFPL